MTTPTADTAWIDRFASTFARLSPHTDGVRCEQIARTLYPDLHTLRPEHAAAMEWEQAAPVHVADASPSTRKRRFVHKLTEPLPQPACGSHLQPRI